MADNVSEPQLTDHTPQPRGVLQKNLKGMLYLGAVVILLAAALLSAHKSPTVAEKAKDQPPQPYVQDNTANNIDTLQRELAANKQREQQDAQLATNAGGGNTAQQSAVAAYGPDGRPLPGAAAAYGSGMAQQGGGQPQLTHEEQISHQLAAKDRERADTARFASNLAYVRTEPSAAAQAQQAQGNLPPVAENPYLAQFQAGQPTSLTSAAQWDNRQAARRRRPLTNARRRSISITPWGSLT